MRILPKEIAPEHSTCSNNEQAPTPSTPSSAQPTTNNVHILVTKLKIGTTLGDINFTFRQFGELEDITLLFENRREAIVQFTYPESVAAALKAGAVHCAGKTVFLQPLATNEVSSSAPTPNYPFPSHNYSTTSTTTTTTRRHHQQGHDRGQVGQDDHVTTSLHGRHESPEYVHSSAPTRQCNSPSPPPPPSSSNRYPRFHSEESHSSHNGQPPPSKNSYHPHRDSLQDPSEHDNTQQQHYHHNKKKNKNVISGSATNTSSSASSSGAVSSSSSSSASSSSMAVELDPPSLNQLIPRFFLEEVLAPKAWSEVSYRKKCDLLCF